MTFENLECNFDYSKLKILKRKPNGNLTYIKSVEFKDIKNNIHYGYIIYKKNNNYYCEIPYINENRYFLSKWYKIINHDKL